MKDFSEVFDKQLQLHNGDLTQFADSDEFDKALRDNGVLLSTYNYSGIDDIVGGLEFAIHTWTESEVKPLSFNIENDGTYSGTLRFVFKDNFGLDDLDVEKYGKWHNGFKSWFILQHYDQFNKEHKPFKTVVEIDYPISGKIEGYNNEKTLKILVITLISLCVLVFVAEKTFWYIHGLPTHDEKETRLFLEYKDKQHSFYKPRY